MEQKKKNNKCEMVTSGGGFTNLNFDEKERQIMERLLLICGGLVPGYPLLSVCR